MFRKTLLIVTAGLLTCPISSWAQDETPAPEEGTATPKTGETPGPNRFWQATLDGGHYMVALDRISSVSRHKYVLDGAVIVDEVTVDSVGQALVRFYFISPITDGVDSNAAIDLANKGRDMIEKVAQRTGSEIQNMVMKKYPDTTHSRTIEYRLQSEQELGGLYNSVRTSWETGRGRKFATKK